MDIKRNQGIHKDLSQKKKKQNKKKRVYIRMFTRREC